jgi:hypothetical protein
VQSLDFKPQPPYPPKKDITIINICTLQQTLLDIKRWIGPDTTIFCDFSTPLLSIDGSNQQ